MTAGITGKTVAKIYIRMSDGVHEVKAADLRTSSSSKRIYASLAASVDPVTVSASLYSKGSPDITTPAVTVTPVGGVGPYSYSWTTSRPSWTAYTPEAPYTSFTHTAVSPGSTYIAPWVCTVTDAAGSTATVTVMATVRNTYGGAPS